MRSADSVLATQAGWAEALLGPARKTTTEARAFLLGGSGAVRGLQFADRG